MSLALPLSTPSASYCTALARGIAAQTSARKDLRVFSFLRIFQGRSRETQSNPGINMVGIPMLQELRRISATPSGWDCPLLTFICPGFEQVAHIPFEGSAFLRAFKGNKINWIAVLGAPNRKKNTATSRSFPRGGGNKKNKTKKQKASGHSHVCFVLHFPPPLWQNMSTDSRALGLYCEDLPQDTKEVLWESRAKWEMMEPKMTNQPMATWATWATWANPLGGWFDLSRTG